MARYTAFTAADTVGSDTTTVMPPGFPTGPIGGFGYIITYPTEYATLRFDGILTNFESYMTSEWSPPFAQNPGVDPVKSYWEATGDTYPAATLFSLVFTPTTTTEEVKQFWFAYDDNIRGSEFDDKLCGWAGDDKMWGYEGDDKFYFGNGMDKDTIYDFDKNDDELCIDEDMADRLKDFKKIKYNDKKEFTKLKGDDGDTLKVYGIYTKKDLKSVIDFEDFTDFA